MVARDRRYFGIPFKGYSGVTQGNPLPPKVFNVVVATIICHWVIAVGPIEDGMEGFGLSIRDLMAYLYASDGLVASN